MHIIFGDNAQFQELSTKYTVLELDTIRIVAENTIHQAYAIIETIALDQLMRNDEMKNLHQALIDNYRTRNWAFCLNAIQQLQGFWSGELDSFYIEWARRIQEFQQQEPSPEWTYIIDR
jgi:hypothetical protein